MEHQPSPDNTLFIAVEVLGTALQLDRERAPGTFAIVADEVSNLVAESSRGSEVVGTKRSRGPRPPP
jgi:hypothetical protein